MRDEIVLVCQVIAKSPADVAEWQGKSHERCNERIYRALETSECPLCHKAYDQVLDDECEDARSESYSVFLYCSVDDSSDDCNVG